MLHWSIFISPKQIIHKGQTLGGDKVSMFTHTHTHANPRGRLKVSICNQQGDSPLYVWPDVWSGDLQVWKKYGHTWPNALTETRRH